MDVTLPIKIEFKMPSMSEQKITEQLSASVVLNADTLEYNVSYYCDELSDSTGMWTKDIYREYNSMFFRSAIVGFTCARNATEDCWHVTLHTIYQVIDINLETEEVCKAMASTLKEWIFGK